MTGARFTRTTWAAVLTLATAAGCARPSPERQFLDDATTALGGRAAIEQATTLAMQGDGTHFNLGQDMRPDATLQTFAVTNYKRTIDVASPRARTELTRTPNFLYFQGDAAQTQVQGLDGNVAYNGGGTTPARRAAAAVVKDRQTEFYHHPLALLRAALLPSTTLSNPRTSGKDKLIDVRLADGATFTLAIDAATHVPARIESQVSHPNLGDVTLSTHFSDYQTVDGLRLPIRFTSKTDAFTTADIHLLRQVLGGAPADLAAPADVAAAPLPASPAPITVTVAEVAPGVWFLAGQSHHSAVVEFSDHLMLIEAPQSEARTLAVIARARELRPGKPLTQLVTSHHHFDHTAGLRAAIAEGLTVITQAGNREFVTAIAARPFTLAPDALARATKPVAIETVDSERSFTDATQTVALYHIAGNPHSDTMLMAYLPKWKLLIEADALSPGENFGSGSDYQPYAANLLTNIVSRKLAIDRIVPLHGGVVPFKALQALPGIAGK